MKKKVIGCCIFFICVSFIFAEGTENKKKFIKGNLSEKTAIVKQAPVNEVVELATDAIDFAINNKEILGDDKEFLLLYAKEILKTKKYDFFIFGHRHVAVDKEIEPGSRYINTGNWIMNTTYAVLNENGLELKSYRGDDEVVH